MEQAGLEGVTGAGNVVAVLDPRYGNLSFGLRRDLESALNSSTPPSRMSFLHGSFSHDYDQSKRVYVDRTFGVDCHCGILLALCFPPFSTLGNPHERPSARIICGRWESHCSPMNRSTATFPPDATPRRAGTIPGPQPSCRFSSSRLVAEQYHWDVCLGMPPSIGA